MEKKNIFKRLIKALLSAALYLGIYLAWSMAIGFILSFAVGIFVQYNFIAELTAAAESYEDLMTQLTSSYETLLLRTEETFMNVYYKYTMLIATAQNLLSLLTFAIIFKVRKKPFFTELKIKRPRLPEVAVMAAFGLAANIVITLVLSLIPFPDAWMNSYEQSVSAIVDSTSVFAVIYTVLVAPITEEILFRGLIHQSLKKAMPMFAAMLISSWIFGMMHGTLIWVIYATLLGLLMVWIFEKRMSLTSSIIFHIGFNAGGVLLGYAETLNIFLVIGSVPVLAACAVYIAKTSEGKISFVS